MKRASAIITNRGGRT
ncbi:hypothetical protein [Photobacterium leiognathi]